MVAVLEKIKTIRLDNLSGGFECGLINYGCMRDHIGHFNYEFKQGVYLLEGECATGGWALSTTLCGKDKYYEGSILFNEKEVKLDKISNYTCYIGEDAGLKKNFGFTPMTVKEQIEYGIVNNLSFSKDIEEIKKRFELSNGRFNRSIKYFSGERWRASMAIGYALGKTIYCLPWMNGRTIRQLEDCFKLCFKVLLEIGAIILIPTTKEDHIKNIVDQYTVVKLENDTL